VRHWRVLNNTFEWETKRKVKEETEECMIYLERILIGGRTAMGRWTMKLGGKNENNGKKE